MTKDDIIRMALAVLKGCLEHPDAQDSIIAIEHELAKPEQGLVGVIGIPTTGNYAMGYAEGFNDACKPKAQPEQEPVAWMDEDGDVLSASIVDGKGLRNIPLYTSPPQRQPLTNEELAGIYMTTTGLDFYRNFARAIEAAHGIGNKT